MLTSGPFPLTLGQPLEVTPPSAQWRFGTVVLANISPFAVAVDIGGPQQWLQAWSADAYPIDQGDQPQLEAAFTTDLTGAITTGQVTAAWYGPADTLAGTYPVALTAQAIAASITAGLPAQSTSSSSGTISKAADGNTVAFIAAPPAGFQNIFSNLYVAPNISTAAQYLISGHVSAKQWMSNTVPPNGTFTALLTNNVDLTLTEGLDLFLPNVGGNVGFLLTYRTVAIP